MSYKPLFLVALIMVTLTACGGGRQSDQQILDELKWHRAVWQANKPERFSYSLDKICFGCSNYPMSRISYEDGSFKSDAIPDLTGRIASNNFIDRGLGIEELFDLIENAVTQGYDGIDVIYDETYGYPLRMDFDRYRGAIDDESAYVLRDVVVGTSEVSKFYDGLIHWAALDIKQYQYTQTIDCFCLIRGDLAVDVAGPYSATAYSEVLMRALNNSEAAATALTFHQLFRLIYDALQSDNEVRAEYSEQYGFPTLIALNESTIAADGGKIITTTEFSFDSSKGLDALRQNREKWSNLDNQTLNYTFRKRCYCIANHYFRVTLEDNLVAEYDAFLTQPREGRVNERPLSVEQMFDEAEAAILGDYADVRIDYHPKYFFPVSIAVDKSQQIADEEYTYTISEVSAPGSELDKLYDHLRIWAEASIWNYRFQYTLSYVARDIGEYAFNVVDGVTVAGFDMNLEQELIPGDLVEFDSDMLQVFESLKPYLNDGVSDVTVAYDVTYDYPVKIQVVSPRHLEGGYTLLISHFEP